MDSRNWQSTAFASAIAPSRRKAARARVRSQAEVLSSQGEAARMVIDDLSPNGCSFWDDAEWLRVGSFVTVAVPGAAALEAIVRWRRNGRTGVEFLRPIPSDHSEWHRLIASEYRD